MYAYYTQGICMYLAWYMHVIHNAMLCIEYTCTMHAWNYAWYKHEDPGKMHACTMPAQYLYIKRPNSLHVPVLNHETCMVRRPCCIHA